MEPTSWHSYPKSLNLGHKLVDDVLDGEVIVQEKVDGSQFSFGVFDGELRARSKGGPLIIDEPETMFAKAIETVKRLAPRLTNGWTYRGEYLQKPKHNALAYDRVPNQHVILFDINVAEADYLPYETVATEAHRLGLEVVPCLYKGITTSLDFIRSLLETTSVLGGQKIEGVVIKNYRRFTADGHPKFAKFVSSDFKEVHRSAWKEANPGQNDIIERLIRGLRTPARWNKAIQHLREDGKLTESAKDIGPLILEIKHDTFVECKPEIMEALMSWAWPDIARGVIRGFPEWYKERLVFGPDAASVTTANGANVESHPDAH
jgi:hypothetical protein